MDFAASDTWFTIEVVGGGLLIALARMADVALGVLRFSNMAAGRFKAAWFTAFFEALIWVAVVAAVIKQVDNPVYAVSYAIGFAMGTFLGMTFEQILAKGEQVVRIFTHMGDKLAEGFRTRGYRVTQIDGRGRDGPVQILFIHVLRKKSRGIPKLARDLDPECFIVVDDVRSSSLGLRTGSGTGAALMRK
jgi:uncharacterized protein YebE (UPF0316 family)